jgi:tol-pal system protein YbgF
MSHRPAAVVLVVMLASGCASTPPVVHDRVAPSAATAADPSPSLMLAEQQRTNEQVTRILGDLAELQNAVAKLVASARRHDDQLAGLERRLGELAERRSQADGLPRGFAPSGRAPASSSPPSTSAPAPDLYNAAQVRVRDRDYDAAVLLFYELVANYPTHALRENAQFAVADIYFQQKDVRGALAEFESLVSAVPNGARTAEALLRVGQCRRVLGDEAGARKVWERVIAEHPKSDAARQARELLRRG